MKLSIASSLLVSTAFLFDDVHASVHRLRGVRGSRSPLTGLGRRVAMSGDLQNSGDVKYWTNVTMGGKSVSLLLDTGRYVFPHFPSRVRNSLGFSIYHFYPFLS